MADLNQQLEAFKKLLVEIEGVVNDDNKAQINGRTYQLSKMTIEQSIPFIQLYQDMQPNPITGVAKEKFDIKKVKDMLDNFVIVDGALIKNIPNYWDNHKKNLLPYVNTMFLVANFDFLADSLQPLKGL